jgi:hypothetical protein
LGFTPDVKQNSHKLAGQRRLRWMSRGERRVNAKSIMGVMMLPPDGQHRGGGDRLSDEQRPWTLVAR